MVLYYLLVWVNPRSEAETFLGDLALSQDLGDLQFLKPIRVAERVGRGKDHAE